MDGHCGRLPVSNGDRVEIATAVTIWYNLSAPRNALVGNVLSQHVLKGSLAPKGMRILDPLRWRAGTHLRNAGFKTRLSEAARSFR